MGEFVVAMVLLFGCAVAVGKLLGVRSREFEAVERREKAFQTMSTWDRLKVETPTGRTRDRDDGDDGPVPRLGTVRMVLDEFLADRFMTATNGSRLRILVTEGDLVAQPRGLMMRLRGRFYDAARRASVTVRVRQIVQPEEGVPYALEVTLYR